MDLGPFEFLPLQRIHPFEFMELDVPARWHCERRKGGMWGCWTEGAESGTLWIDFDVASIADGIDVDRAMELALRSDQPKVASEPMRDCHGGEEDGVELRFHRWTLMTVVGPLWIARHHSLVLVEDLADRPDFQCLLATMDDAILRAGFRLNPALIRRYGVPDGEGGYCGRFRRAAS